MESRHELDTELRKAIDNGDIGIASQPIVAVGNGDVVAVEALARWNHAELGAAGRSSSPTASTRSDRRFELQESTPRR